MRQRASTLMEVLVGVLVAGIVLAGFLPAFSNLWRMQMASVTLPGVENNAKNMALKLADGFRGATLCTSSDTGCTVDGAAENASTTAITIYRRDASGVFSKYTYAVTGGNFTLQIDSNTATTICNGATLALTYYGASSYNSTTLAPFTPTNTTLKTLAAVGISTSVTTNGITGSYSTMIRLRNSPKP